MDDMKEKWYMNDWFITIVATLALLATVVGNYYLHGGRIVW